MVHNKGHESNWISTNGRSQSQRYSCSNLMLAIGGAPLLVLATMGVRTVLSATTVCVAPLLELAASVGGRAVWGMMWFFGFFLQ